MLATFNRVTRTTYRPPVAKVYGTHRGVAFQQVFKTLRAAQRVAAQYHGIVIPLTH